MYDTTGSGIEPRPTGPIAMCLITAKKRNFQATNRRKDKASASGVVAPGIGQIRDSNIGIQGISLPNLLATYVFVFKQKSSTHSLSLSIMQFIEKVNIVFHAD